MAEPFEQKEYGEYFKILEEKLNNTEKKPKNIPQSDYRVQRYGCLKFGIYRLRGCADPT